MMNSPGFDVSSAATARALRIDSNRIVAVRTVAASAAAAQAAATTLFTNETLTRGGNVIVRSS